jgi:membrane peptidoglycan carboxypeptidase
MIGGVWIGNDDNRATRKVTGGGASAALFAKVMTAAHRDLKPEPLHGAEMGRLWLDATFEDEAAPDTDAPAAGADADTPSDAPLEKSPLSQSARASTAVASALQQPVQSAAEPALQQPRPEPDRSAEPAPTALSPAVLISRQPAPREDGSLGPVKPAPNAIPDTQ